jgi:cell division control protein 45
MGVVKEGPDVALFSHPGALVKLAAWVGEAVAVLEAEKGRRKNDHEALVLGCLDEVRGVYVVVGLGSGGAGKKVRSKAEIRERENKKKRKAADKAAKKAERARKKRERKEWQREMNEANGILDSEDEEEDESDATESEASDSSDSDSDSDDELVQARKKRGHGLNRFGQAFQEVVEETGARVRIDSFEHSVVEVRKEDLAGFLEALSLRSVVG